MAVTKKSVEIEVVPVVQTEDVVINHTGTAPTKKDATDAGWDLYAAEEVAVTDEYRTLVGTGTYIELPEDMCALLIPRSSLSVKRDIQMVNGVGLIDAGYRGEIKAPLLAMSGEVVIAKGERIAQLLIVPVPRVRFERVDQLGVSVRGEGGFGSTGVA